MIGNYIIVIELKDNYRSNVITSIVWSILKYNHGLNIYCAKHFKEALLVMLISSMLLIVSSGAYTKLAPPEINDDETMVPDYVLPDPLLCLDNTTVNNADVWFKKRRPEILHLFEEFIYGKVPGELRNINFKVISVDSESLNGKAIRKEVEISFGDYESSPIINILGENTNESTSKYNKLARFTNDSWQLNLSQVKKPPTKC
jgi:hypothetical protein